ncbi:MAG: response regulator, partial [Bacteroidota bacterium]
VQEVVHDLKNSVMLDLAEPAHKQKGRLKAAIQGAFFHLVRLLPEKKEALGTIQERITQQVISETNPGGSGRTQDAVSRIAGELASLAPEPEQEESHLFAWTKWKALIVEDESLGRQTLQAGFERNKAHCILVSNAKEAKRWLEEDENTNTITVLVCDLRLKDESTGLWQPMQGGDVLAMARNMPNYLSFFALTSAQKRLLHLRQQRHRMPLGAYYKPDVMEAPGGMNLFVQKIREEGDAMFFKSRNRPTAASWKTQNQSRFGAPLSLYYREHLLASDYEQAEEFINAVATGFVENAVAGKANPETPFLGTFKAPPQEPGALAKFRERVLIGRRIALALWFLDWTKEKIGAAILSGSHDLQTLKLLFNTTLCLSFQQDIPKKEDVERGRYLTSGLLEEEIRWLAQERGVGFNLETEQTNRRDIEALDYLLEEFNHVLKLKAATQSGKAAELQSFMQDRFRFRSKVDLTLVRQKLKTADKIARQLELKKEFARCVDLADFSNPELRQILEETVLRL